MKSPTAISLMVAAICAMLGTSMLATAQSAPAATQQSSGAAGPQGGMHRDHKGMRHHRGHGASGMARLDINKDGAVSKAEFDKHFETLDANRDGKVDAAEQKAFHDQMRAKMRQARADRGRGVCRADSNRDGAVSRAEAEKFGPRALPRFDAADVNRDGTLDATELKAQCPVRAAL